MVWPLRVVLLCSFWHLAAASWAQEPLVYSPEQMHADLHRFKTALIEVHPGTFTHQSPEELEQLVQRLLLETSQPLEAEAFYGVVLRLIASIHDGHTQAYPRGKLAKALEARGRLPFQIHVQGERLFVRRNLSPHEIPEGSEFLSFDGRPSSQVLREILEHYSADGSSRSGMLHWLGGPYRSFDRIYPELYGKSPSHRLVFRNRQTREVTALQVARISSARFAALAAEATNNGDPPHEEAFSFSLVEKPRHAYLWVRRFFKDGYDEPESTYPDFYRHCFETIRRQGIRNLVVDLRDNGGGKASNAAHLLRYFIDHPVTPARSITTLGNDADFLQRTGLELDLDQSFGLKRRDDGRFDVTRADVLRDLEEYQPIEEDGFDGRLVVLINGGTASAAAIAAGLIREHTDALFVGEETFGYAGLSNGVRQISILGQHTETAIHLPLLHAEYAVNEHVRKRGVLPDYPVAVAVDDLLSDRDRVLEQAHQLLLPTEP